MHQFRALQDRVRSELHTALDPSELSSDTPTNEQETDRSETAEPPEHVGLPDDRVSFQ
jgi:hypothetical protein